MKNRIITILVILCIALMNAEAQEEDKLFKNFTIEGRIINNKSVFKILPTNQGAWFLGMKNGYSVYISTFENGGFSEYTLINNNLIPAPSEDFKSPSLPYNYAEAMRKMIYEETYEPRGTSFDELLSANETMSYHLLAYILFSSYDTTLSAMSGLQFSPQTEPGTKFKLKVEINNHLEYVYEKIITIENLHSKTQSLHFEALSGDKNATIQWMHKDFKDMYVAYALERSDNQSDFKQIGTPIPFNSVSKAGKLGMISWVDSLPQNYKSYYYTVRGYDFFGYLSDPGDTLMVMGKDMTAPLAPFNVYAEHSSIDSISIHWSQVSDPDLHGFQVISSKTETGEYTLVHEDLLAPTQFSYRFKIESIPDKYYRVISVDTARNANASTLSLLILTDTIPPSTPDSVFVSVDSNHVATIKWTASKDVDVSGYRVFKAYHPSNGFVPITPKPIMDTLFIDSLSLKRTDRKVYYKVLATDNNFNRSKLSNYSIGIIPDFSPPIEPLLIKAELNASGNSELEWISSASDVANFIVIRKKQNDSIYQTIDSLTFDIKTYTDLYFDTLNVNYAEYYIVAVDSAGNNSDLSNGKRVIKKNKAQQDDILISSITDINKQIEVVWNYSSEEDYSVLVYRSVDDGNFSLIDRVSDQSDYVDNNVMSGKRYTYKLGILESSGKRLPLSVEKSINVK